MKSTRHTLRRLFLIVRRNRYVWGTITFAQEFFLTLLVTYISLLLVETIWPNSISLHLNLAFLLILVTAVGLIAVVTIPAGMEDEKQEHPTKGKSAIVICGTIAGVVAVWYNTSYTGWLSYLIPLLCGLWIFFLLRLFLREKDEEGTSRYR